MCCVAVPLSAVSDLCNSRQFICQTYSNNFKFLYLNLLDVDIVEVVEREVDERTLAVDDVDVPDDLLIEVDAEQVAVDAVGFWVAAAHLQLGLELEALVQVGVDALHASLGLDEAAGVGQCVAYAQRRHGVHEVGAVVGEHDLDRTAVHVQTVRECCSLCGRRRGRRERRRCGRGRRRRQCGQVDIVVDAAACHHRLVHVFVVTCTIVARLAAAAALVNERKDAQLAVVGELEEELLSVGALESLDLQKVKGRLNLFKELDVTNIIHTKKEQK